MGLYGEQVLPRMLNAACAMGPAVASMRDRVCAGLCGRVVEVGFGSGLNVAHYPAGVSSVTAVEPSNVAWRLAGERVAASAVPVQRAGLDGQALPFGDDSFDCALSTWTMCTIPDLATALGELRRVLRPGGTLHFLEHGLAPDEPVARWQRRLEPWQRRLVGGCHLTRNIVESIQQAGFVITELEVFYEKGAPKVLGAEKLGVASL
ncbi:MAG TPA: class I SAM-dependent methyltransferase [Nocardioidaceae bacterium]|nr:class I SAM-dependent methyltransferase [Nocardioidaceae bacterium]